MQIYNPPIKDYNFLLDVFDYASVQALPGNEDYDRETIDAILQEVGKFCSEKMLPLNRTGDQQGLKFDPATGSVTTPDGFPKLWKQFCRLGLVGMGQPVEFGGGGAPTAVSLLLGEMTTATNKSFSMCAGLTHGLVDSVLHYGTPAQKEYWLPKMISGEWTGTMCLTEPQCGTDLGLLKTRATPDPANPGDFLLTGSKIWITFGDHDMAKNVVHLVLGRLPDAPPGIKGISTFLVPKFKSDGTRNPVFVTGLEHKMGINASPTCVISMDDAQGTLIGEPHRGMATMFVMMNAARLSVGLEGVALAEIAYQTALEFAKERRQGRSLDKSKRETDQEADNILVHPDVRRLLLNSKATNEAMRGLAVWVACHLDTADKHPDEAVRQKSDDLVALMTPIVKSYMTERGFLNINDSMQVMGGAGYTTDWSVEQYMRDSRIAMIYEGTNHIQALDLVGRKLPIGGGRLIRTFQGEVSALITEHKGNEAMTEFITALKDVSKQLTAATMDLAAKGMKDRELVGAIASNYLNLFALTVLTWIWCKQVGVALTRDDAYSATKVKTARYFMRHVLPERHMIVALLASGKDAIMDFDADEL